MPVLRLALLLVVLGGLTLLLAQNWSPVLPLVFLGVKTQALPLAVWISISLVAGAFTSLLITGLFKVSNYFARPGSKRRNKVEASPPRSSTQQRSEAYYSATSAKQSDTASTPSDTSDDWGSNSTTDDDDWDFGEDAEPTRNFSSQDTVNDSTNYEASTEPKSGYRAGSVYSYSYREPSDSGVGKTESVYDADYRVIAPPYKQPDTVQEDEDWGFEDEDDFDDEVDSDPNKRR